VLICVLARACSSSWWNNDNKHRASGPRPVTGTVASILATVNQCCVLDMPGPQDMISFCDC
jgi:hypothetical protein